MEVGGEKRCGDGGGVRWEERGMCCCYPPVLLSWHC